ncbi:hypothetical protein LOTGIDRAFT_105149 [Lottia gigantea]|uniref:Hexosyltransferase n=1 Tax=Lottia gigantea TaxID=225164 RepID=V4AFK0_LOTGI|nr:hypothetical protein LOTGIDRAFT_105149 [Lottia gigantea]ESO93885.1 hypothetical protein LOTGIDRAFT_105149 [Lottia gigantea]
MRLSNKTVRKENVILSNETVRKDKILSNEKVRKDKILSNKTVRKENVILSNKIVRKDKILSNKTVRKENVILSNKTVRKDKCSNCFLHNFKYEIINSNICKVQNDITVDIFIIIFSIPRNIANRNAIRKTWVSASRNNTANTRYAFFFGISSDKNILFQEAKIYKDIIMEDFQDSYQNLTYKTMMGFKFVTLFCNNAKYILKTDDDMWINLNWLNEYLRTNSQKLINSVGGYCFKSASPIRKKSSKWYAGFESYPSKKYPGFCSGTGYIFTNKTAQQVFEISRNVPFYHLEDVYVSLCIRQLGYTLEHIPGFRNGTGTNADLCRYKKKSVITWHKVPPGKLLKIWSKNCTQ